MRGVGGDQPGDSLRGTRAAGVDITHTPWPSPPVGARALAHRSHGLAAPTEPCQADGQMDRRRKRGRLVGGVFSSADVSTPGLGLLVSRSRAVGRGGQPLGVLVPGAPRRMDGSQSSH